MRNTDGGIIKRVVDGEISYMDGEMILEGTKVREVDANMDMVAMNDNETKASALVQVL